MVWLGIVLAPFGSGKTTHRDSFSAYLPGSKARVLSVDDYVYRHPRYRKAIAEARPNRKTLRQIYLQLVKTAQKEYDADVNAVLAEGKENLVLEESGRSPRWGAWFASATLAHARKSAYQTSLVYLAVGPREAYIRCQQRRTVPVIPKREFHECRAAAAMSFVSLASQVDRATIFLTVRPLPAPPSLFCTLRPFAQVEEKASYETLETLISLPSPQMRSTFKRCLRPCFPFKGGWVTLVMGGDRYVPGALVLGQSLKNVQTAFDTVCMVAGGVSPGALERLAQVFTHVRPVEVLSTPARPMRGKKQKQLYSKEFTSTIFTKWNCLAFAEYDKIVCVDADVVFQANADDLFDLDTPAGTFDNPWHSGEGWYGHLSHGAPVSSRAIQRAYKSPQGYVVFGSLVVLAPSRKDFRRLEKLLAHDPPYGNRILSSNGPDELAITELYVPQTGKAHQTWTHVDPRYHLIPWKTYSPPLGAIPLDEARALHYFGKEKPWEMGRNTWADLKVWWNVWDSLPNVSVFLRSDFPNKIIK